MGGRARPSGGGNSVVRGLTTSYESAALIPRVSSALGGMGKITRRPGIEDVKVKVTRNSGPSPCGAELVGFLACLDLNGGDERECGKSREALNTCMDLAMRSGLARRRHKPAINFHLKQVRAKEARARASRVLNQVLS
jgi:hypothetical protein